MKLSTAPQAVLGKLLALDEHAASLSAAAEAHDRRLADVRNRLNGKRINRRDDYAALEAELPRLFETQPQLRNRATREQQVLSSCKYFLDRLPDGTVLDVVEVTPSADLPAVRAQIVKLGEERRAIINAPPAPSEMADEVKRWVATIGEQGNPSRLLTDNSFSPRWGGSAVVDPSDRPRSPFAFLCWLVPDIVTARFQQELEARASALSKLPRAERAQRLSEIEAAIVTARYAEEVLVATAIQSGEDVTRDSAAPPEAVLQVQLRSEAAASLAASARSATARAHLAPGERQNFHG
jgi:hypothetical protein